MGTKALARTIIEGGRARRNVFERRHSNQAARAAERVYEQALAYDLDYWQDHVAPRRAWVGVWQHDKLGAPCRWLRAQRGRLWDDVYAEIRARFDTRTIPGHHIVFDHLLREIDFGHVHHRPFARSPLCVDEAGRLQLSERRRGHNYHHRVRPTPPSRRLLAWLGDRRVGLRGSAWYWFVAVAPRVPTRPDARPAFRQTGRLDAAEVRAWEAFSAAGRADVTLSFDGDGRLARGGEAGA